MRTLTKSLIILVCLLAFSQFTHGQHSNIIIYSEHGERFSVSLNGVLKTPSPRKKVGIMDIQVPSFRVKIEFEDQRIPPVVKNIKLGKNIEATYIIRKDRNNRYILSLKTQEGIVPLPHPGGEDHGGGHHEGGWDGDNTGFADNDEDHPGGGDDGHYVMPGYHGPIGCPYPISEADFESAKKTIADKSFDDSKLEIAKQVTRSNCLLAAEVKAIMELFNFESSRLDFAKYAYKYTYDQGNYFKVNEAFSFDSSIHELNEYIGKESHK